MDISAPPPAVQMEREPPGLPRPPAALKVAETGKALRALLFNELWPNLPYALGILAILGLISMLPQVVEALRPANGGNNSANILSREDIQSLVTPACALIGLALGVLQGRVSSTTHQWSFLVHRPMHRGYIFLGRVLAGVILYGIAAGVPAAALIIYAASSRGIPFHWRFTLPIVVEVAAGFVYYLAGLLMAERKAFILASKGVPLLAAVACSMVAFVVPWFSQAMVIVLAFAALMAVAGLGAVMSDGYTLRVRPVAGAAMLLVLFVGIASVLIPLGQWGKVSLKDWAEPRVARLEQIELSLAHMEVNALPRFDTLYFFLPDGRLAKWTQWQVISEDLARPQAPYLDLDSGKPLDPQPDANQMYEISRGTTRIKALLGPPHYNEIDRGLATASEPYPENEVWFFLRAGGVLQAYSRGTHAYLGGIGEEGFVPAGRSPTPFATQSLQGGLYAGPKGIYKVDLMERSLALRAAVPAGSPMWGWGDFAANLTPQFRSIPPQTLALVTRDQILLYSEKSNQQEITLAVPHTNAATSMVIMPLISSGLWGVRYAKSSEATEQQNYDVFDANGKQISHHAFAGVTPATSTLPPQAAAILQGRVASLPEAASVRRNVLVGDGLLDAMGGVPLVWLVAQVAGPAANVDPREMTIFRPNLNPWYAGTVAVVLAISVAFMLLLLELYGVQFKAAWVLAAVLLGPMALFLVAFTHEAPLTLPCGKCGETRYLSQPRCPACGADFALPSPNGTEIFSTHDALEWRHASPPGVKGDL